MKKTLLLILAALMTVTYTNAQKTESFDLGVGLKFQKTEQLYWESGVAADFTSDFLLNKKIHLKMSYVTSRLGSAMIGNAVKQDNFVVGADWRFRSQKDFQIFTGLNTGFFHADMETPMFTVLPHNSMLFSVEAGLFYKFKFPVSASLSAGYNLISGDGVSGPGTLFPVFYQLSIFYSIGKK